jgi:opacity protein-like surface antigen
MMKLRQVLQCGSVAALLALAAAVPAQAQVTRVDSGRQAIGFNLGYFNAKGFDSRVDEDVLLANVSQGELSLAFDIDDFDGATFGGEWLIGLNDYLEAGVGVSFYQNTVPSVYDQKVRDDGREIAQELKLRFVPITGTIRFLPIGRNGVAPYVGGGIGAFNFRYSEVGEFIDNEGFTFTDRFIKSGWSAGPVILGGIRFPIGDAITVGGELRYQKAEGKGLLEEDFLADQIDLGGWTTSFTMHFRF